MKNLILEVIAIILLSSLINSRSVKNVQYVYKGISKLGFVNEKVVIECPISGQFYLWKFYNRHSEPQVLLEQEGKVLTLESVTTDKSGIYECKSTTGFVNTDTNITVKIIDPQSEVVREICSLAMLPKIRELTKGICFYNDKISKTTRYKIGEDAELDCTAVGIELKYLWSFTDENGIKNQIPMSHNISKILIKSVIPENDGLYKCEVLDKYGLRILQSFKVSISESTSDINIEIVGDKQDDLTVLVGQKINLRCEVKNNFDRIYSVKWGKRIRYPVLESMSKSNIVSWDQFTYKLLNATEDSNINPNHILSTLTLTQLDPEHSGIYTCLAMDSRGRTVHKIFNLTVSSSFGSIEHQPKSYFFLLYIILPVILIFAGVCVIIYCCVKSSSKKSHTSLPLKKYASPKPNNTTKETGSNYYYPANNTRLPLPQPNESQASLVSPNTLTSYSSYGNYHMQSTNQPSCCSSNGV